MTDNPHVTRPATADRSKFDLQLAQGIEAENAFAALLGPKAKLEIKSESFQWQETGNLCIEFACDGKPSGIAVTQADFWCHQLSQVIEGQPTRSLGWITLPMPRIKELARKAYKAGDYRHNSGDGGRFSVVLVKITDIFPTNNLLEDGWEETI